MLIGYACEDKRTRYKIVIFENNVVSIRLQGKDYDEEWSDSQHYGMQLHIQDLDQINEVVQKMLKLKNF